MVRRELIAVTVLLAAPTLGLVVMSAKGRPRKAAGRGFGAKPSPKKAPPTLEEAAARFAHRLPADTQTPCPCGGGAYEQCCRPYHLGEVLPDSATRVLQSRFSAFAYRLPLHLIRTTHATNRDFRDDGVAWARSLNREGMFDDFEFVRLEAGSEEVGQNDDERYIDFRAVLRPRAGGEEVAFRERSRFLREGGGWLYASGDVVGDGAGLDDAVLNRG